MSFKSSFIMIIILLFFLAGFGYAGTDYAAIIKEFRTAIPSLMKEASVPGLFFTSNGEILDLLGSVPTWRNIRLKKIVNSAAPMQARP